MSRDWPVQPEDVVLGTLAGPEAAEADRLLREEPAFRAEVERVRTLGDAITTLPADAWAPATPPPLDRAAALAARAPRAGRLPVRGPARPGRRRLVLRPLPALAAAAALAGVGLLAGLALGGGDDAPRRAATTPGTLPGQAVTLTAFGTPGAQRADVRLPAGAGGTVQLAVAGAAPSRPGEYYELWLLDTAEHLTSVGTFRVGADGTARGRFALGVDPAAYRYLDVSLERDDGDPAHSRHSILRSAART